MLAESLSVTYQKGSGIWPQRNQKMDHNQSPGGGMCLQVGKSKLGTWRNNKKEQKSLITEVVETR